MKTQVTARRKQARGWIVSLATAVLATAVALAARIAIERWVGDNLPYLTFFPAVAFAGYFGGLSAGLITTILGAILADYFFVAPRHTLFFAGTGEWIGFAGYVLGSAAICLLIRSRSQAQDEVHETEAAQLKFASIVDSAMDAIITVDARQRVLAFNHAAEQIFACPAAKALGQPLDKFMPQRFREAHHRHVQAFGQTGVTSRSMYRPGTLWGLRSNGEEFPIEATISQVELHGDKLFTVILRDVSERVRAEAALLQSQERLHLAHQATSLGAWEWNIRTGGVLWSDEVCRLHGMEPGTFDGTYESWLKTVHPDDREGVEAAVRNVFSGGGPYATEYRTLRPDGSMYWTAARGQLSYDEQGQPDRLVGVCMDITERRESEEMLRKAEKLAAAGRMAASVAHEINNPLASVVNLLYLLEGEPLRPKAREYLASAWAELNRVVRITRQSLAFYRERNSEPVPTDICQSLDQALNTLRADGHCASVGFIRECERPALVHSYSDELVQVFANLLRNSVEAGSSKVRIRVCAGYGWNGVNREGVRITIADNGKGIERRHLHRLFEPFYTTKETSGTGLGLWVSKGIVDKHEGHIAVRSSTQPGLCGTVLSIFLPSAIARKPVERADSKRAKKSTASL